jgi:hypothetical protein
MKEETIRKIESLIWATEHMDSKSGSPTIVQNNHGRAQGAIFLAYELGIIDESEYNKYWDAATQACYDNASYWVGKI